MNGNLPGQYTNEVANDDAIQMTPALNGDLHETATRRSHTDTNDTSSNQQQPVDGYLWNTYGIITSSITNIHGKIKTALNCHKTIKHPVF